MDENSQEKLEESNNIRNSVVLSQRWIQILSWVALVGMFITDKILGLPSPALPEYWYGIAFGTAASGKFLDVFRELRR